MFYEAPVGWSRSKYKETRVFLSCGPNAGQDLMIKIANKFF